MGGGCAPGCGVLLNPRMMGKCVCWPREPGEHCTSLRFAVLNHWRALHRERDAEDRARLFILAAGLHNQSRHLPLGIPTRFKPPAGRCAAPEASRNGRERVAQGFAGASV